MGEKGRRRQGRGGRLSPGSLGDRSAIWSEEKAAGLRLSVSSITRRMNCHDVGAASPPNISAA